MTTHTAIINGNVLHPDGTLQPNTVLVKGMRIVGIQPPTVNSSGDTLLINAQGGVVVPGYIDLHVHGGNGADTMDATAQALDTMSRFFAQHGVTSFAPTTVTADSQSTMAAIEAVANWQRRPAPGAQALGMHLEGPYISEKKMGAQNPAHVRRPNPAEYEALFARGNILLISIAPELPGIEPFVRWAVGQGATVAVGHSLASYEQVMRSVEWGLSQATHTYNAMQGLHHREPGTTGAVLTCDRIDAQIIADLIHVHPAMVKLLWKAKGTAHTLLVTDAMRAAGLPDGEFELGGLPVWVRDGQARLEEGNLAGSTLTMDQAVGNMVNGVGVPLAEALRMASLSPAQSVGLDTRKGKLEHGYDADIVVLDQDLTVQMTMVGGRIVWP